MDSQLLQLSHRVDQLLVLLIVVVAALVGLAVLGGLLILRLSRRREVVGEITVKGRSGDACLTLSVDDGGHPSLIVWGDGQQLHISIMMLTEGNGPALGLFDADGRVRVMLRTSPELGSFLGLWDESGEVRLQLEVSPEGEPRILAGSAGSGDHDLLARVAALEKANRAYLGTYQYALRYWSRVKGADSEAVADVLLRLAIIKDNLGESEEAESLCHRALTIWEKIKGPESEEVAGCLLNLGQVSRARGQLEEAESRFRRSLAIREKRLGPDHPEVAESLSALVSLHHDRGEYAEGEPLQRRVVAIWRGVLGAEHPDVVAQLEYHAGLLRSLGRNDEAQAVESGLTVKSP